MSLFVISQSLYRFFASSLFFKIVIGFFTLSSVFIALFSLYPMAFDENFHVGLIRAYSELWLPFGIEQKPAYDVFGAVVTDPSYLYHYLMSFPYRVLQGLLPSEVLTILALRLLNIAFCVGSLFVFRRLLREAKVSPAITNVTFAFVVLLPVMSLLAGQVNYDNLVMLILAYVLLLAYRIRVAIVSENRILAVPLFLLVTLLAYTSVIKYAFLPIAVAVVVYLIAVYFKHVKTHKRVWKQFWGDVRHIGNVQKVTLSIVFVIGLGLFAQRYAVNVMRYKDPVPDCAAVVSVERCMAYGPWGRDYRYENNPNKPQTDGPILYTLQDWSWGMWHRTFFTLAGPSNSYQTKKQLPIISYSAIALFVIVALSVFWQGRSVLRRYPVFVLVLSVVTVYVLALWQQQYGSYVQTGQPVAINGRYLLPLWPVLGAFGLLAFASAARNLNVQKYLAVFTVITLVIFLQGGGAITYIVRSEPIWFWFNDPVQSVTSTARDIISPFIVK
jgi:hypothetical protein